VAGHGDTASTGVMGYKAIGLFALVAVPCGVDRNPLLDCWICVIHLGGVALPLKSVYAGRRPSSELQCSLPTYRSANLLCAGRQ